MAKLLTHHDRYHVHALLGLTALLHFCYRFAFIFTYRSESFGPTLADGLSLLVHFGLHATSFRFPLPRRRMFSKPMIWSEFRAHNAVFAYRHLVGCVVGILLPQWWWGSPTPASVLCKLGLSFATMAAADEVTRRLGSADERTTNAMPYPPGTPPEVERSIKTYYAKAQFAATSFSLFGAPTISFACVLPIEIASFMMTLVRKGLVEARTYHLVYGLALGMVYPVLFVTCHAGAGDGAAVATWRSVTVTFFILDLRLKRRVNKYAAWGAAIVLGFGASELLASAVDFRWVIWLSMVWHLIDTLWSSRALFGKTEAPAETHHLEKAPSAK